MQKLTRRELVAIATVSLASLATAQTAPSATDGDLYKAAIESNKQDSAVLAQFQIPMSTEPAFQFKA